MEWILKFVIKKRNTKQNKTNKHTNNKKQYNFCVKNGWYLNSRKIGIQRYRI